MFLANSSMGEHLPFKREGAEKPFGESLVYQGVFLLGLAHDSWNIGRSLPVRAYLRHSKTAKIKVLVFAGMR